MPFLQTGSFFFVGQRLLNSVVNPLLYCFVLNRHFSNAILVHKKEVLQLPRLQAGQRSRLSSVATACGQEQEKVEDLEHVAGS